MEGNTQSKKRVFQCDTCSKVLKHKFSLSRHVKVVHGGLRPHNCDCGKNFATTEQLTRHINSKHSNHKPYVCERGCGEAFASYTARVYHHRSVHERIKYVCPIIGCWKQYSTSVHLKNHLTKPHQFYSMLKTLFNRQ